MKILSCPTLYFDNPVSAEPEHHHLAAEIIQTVITECLSTRWNIAFSGSLLDWLAEKRAKGLMTQLMNLHRDGKIEILLSPAFSPAPALGEEAYSRHLDYSLNIWRSLGEESELGIFLPDSVVYPGKYRPALNAALRRSPKILLIEGAEGLGEILDITHEGIKHRVGSASVQELDLTEEKLRAIPPTGGDGSLFAVFLPVFRPLKKLGRQHDERNIISHLRTISRLFSGTAGASLTARSLGSVQAEDRALESFPTPKPFESALTMPAALRRLFPLHVRLADISQVKSKPNPAETKRLLDAGNYVLRAESEEFLIPSFLSRPDLRNLFASLVISADVELDYLLNPKVDPTVGWVRLAKHDGSAGGAAEFTIDTQLSKLALHPSSSGALTAFEYKPLKFNLLSAVDPETSLPLASFTDTLAPLTPEQRKTGELPRIFGLELPTRRVRPTKHSLDLLTLRVEGPLSDNYPNSTLIKDFTFKAGVGAHLPTATTGLAVEYWIESASALPADETLVLEINIVLPSLEPGSMVLRPLLCFGAISPEQRTLDRERLIPSEAIEGGLFGLRLIDGISGFTVDFRSAKQLTAAHVTPLISQPTSGRSSAIFQGLAVRIALSASRIIGDSKSNTLFVSIV